jgi:hypothetical protein
VHFSLQSLGLRAIILAEMMAFLSVEVFLYEPVQGHDPILLVSKSFPPRLSPFNLMFNVVMSSFLMVGLIQR